MAQPERVDRKSGEARKLMPVEPYTAYDEISYLRALLEQGRVAPFGARHPVTGRQAFANAAWLILTDRRRFDESVDVEQVKTWIRTRLFEDPGLERGRLLDKTKELWLNAEANGHGQG